ncbi:uncharacterized protein MONBRDRAFT_21619 [Monosiga brevicollis MX1]|uniref:valine--tRNA ligase n=1 Tax=Monosiga brevicollis TaxID=81824 RepID=A9V591_MONBE|nr:uncharacterized protein MONBRDRAFT_21619 [Monosiga brevicollis MX1]EDQ87235.1 predicted protein [Monosiga brevicollis MX1]|eukprot:XP_001747848.1 hypothetical protein [Monosiga brevicollis MX1]
MLPPPNVTGTLHLGHALTIAVQDALARWHRMLGHEVLWLPGADHAGIATQTVVEKHLWKTQETTRHQLGRDAFIQEVFKWRDEKAGRIFHQMRMLGASLDWSREVFTMDQRFTKAVRSAFIRLHRQGLIYRAHRIVNWSPALQSAISDIEVDMHSVTGPARLNVPRQDRQGRPLSVDVGRMYAIRMDLCDGSGAVTVQTTRPETLPGDVAVAVNPDDTRYRHLIGRRIQHPVSGAELPIVGDASVDADFGSGVVKITPAHDEFDFELAQRHQLPAPRVIDWNGTMRSGVPIDLQGMDRLEARAAIVQQLTDSGHLENVFDHAMAVPICSRSGDVVEPMLCPQWYMDCSDLAQRALERVENGHLSIEPALHAKEWQRWLGEIKPWCLSRQLWWGHQIPAFGFTAPCGKQEYVVADDEGTARDEVLQQYGADFAASVTLTPEEDVLDTWFSSGLYPFAALGWPESTPDFAKFFPNTLLETGSDILFFWVARMVMLSLALTDQVPFRQVLLHPLVRDGQGRKMSKSVGNVIDPLDVIHGKPLNDMLAENPENLDKAALAAREKHMRRNFPKGIPECGADALRLTLLNQLNRGPRPK